MIGILAGMLLGYGLCAWASSVQLKRKQARWDARMARLNKKFQASQQALVLAGDMIAELQQGAQFESGVVDAALQEFNEAAE